MLKTRRLVAVTYRHATGEGPFILRCWLTEGYSTEQDLPQIVGIRQGVKPETLTIENVETLRTQPVPA